MGGEIAQSTSVSVFRHGNGQMPNNVSESTMKNGGDVRKLLFDQSHENYDYHHDSRSKRLDEFLPSRNQT